jgi:ABC-type sugar transport system ATPase subunit
LLRIIAGLEIPDGGEVFFDGQTAANRSAGDRRVGFVFQHYALFRHMTVFENVAFGLQVKPRPERLSKTAIVAKVNELLSLVQLDRMADRHPSQLSGGQRQRVALGRAIVREPLAFLFDEPLSNLDAQLRVETRVELSRLHRELGATMVYVTHDQSEALTLGDRIAILRDGVLQQVASPMELYERPANRFVAAFIGSPAMNFFEGSLTGSEFTGSGLTLSVKCDAALDRVVLGVRPHHVAVVGTERGMFSAEVGVVEPMGNEQIVYARLSDGGRLVAIAPPEPRIEAGQIVGIRMTSDAVHIFDAESGMRVNCGL